MALDGSARNGGARLGAGRKAGVPNRRSIELIERLRAAGKVDPVEYLASVVSGEGEPVPDPGLRVAAANALAPYLHSRLQPRPTPRYIAEPLNLPTPTSAREAAAQIAEITTRAANGLIDLDEAKTLISNLKDYSAAFTASDLEAIVDRVRAEIAAEIAKRG